MSIALTKKTQKTFFVFVSDTIYCVMKMNFSSHSKVMRHPPPFILWGSVSSGCPTFWGKTQPPFNLLSSAASDIYRGEQELNCNMFIRHSRAQKKQNNRGLIHNRSVKARQLLTELQPLSKKVNKYIWDKPHTLLHHQPPKCLLQEKVTDNSG